MPAKQLLAVTLLFFSHFGFCQQADSATSETKRPNIKLETMDGAYYKGRVIEVDDYWIKIDAAPYNHIADLRAYYLRNDGLYYKIDMEYIKSATIKKGRQIGSSTIIGIISGSLILGSLGFIGGSEFGGNFPRLRGLAYGTGVGIGLGAIFGAFSGITAQKNIQINGSSEKMKTLSRYFRPLSSPDYKNN